MAGVRVGGKLDCLYKCFFSFLFLSGEYKYLQTKMCINIFSKKKKTSRYCAVEQSAFDV